MIPFFVESYGDGENARRLRFDVRTDNGRILYRDSTALNRRGGLYAGTITVPIARVAIGAMGLAAWIPGRPDTVRVPLFVGFGGDLPVASFEDMLNYLRWFAAPYRLQALRDTVPEQRSAAWSAFVRDYANANGTGDAGDTPAETTGVCSVTFTSDTPGIVTGSGSRGPTRTTALPSAASAAAMVPAMS